MSVRVRAAAPQEFDRVADLVGLGRHDRVPAGLGGPGSPDEIPPLVYSFALPARGRDAAPE